MVKSCVLFLVFLSLQSRTIAQVLPLEQIAARNVPHINNVFNRIFNDGLDSFYYKLSRLKSDSDGVVSIVHIGDSHIQANFLTAVVRSGLQQYFGNAGRGLVFPYQVARSNAPSDISSYSNTSWNYNRLSHPETAVACGISGFCVQSQVGSAKITLSLKPDPGLQQFRQVKLFVDDNPAATWQFESAGVDSAVMIPQDSSVFGRNTVMMDEPGSSFSLELKATDGVSSFYGASLLTGEPGVLYHSIGVNGARYDQFNGAPLFWKQLPALKADLYIVSLGTNEAQAAGFNETAFIEQVKTFLENVKTASPGALVVITTAADSYKAGRPNAVLKALNFSLENFCRRQHIPFWDLYKITNGYGSARSWYARGLMSRDRVHFTAEGYHLQGQLLLNALIKGYNDYQLRDQNLR